MTMGMVIAIVVAILLSLTVGVFLALKSKKNEEDQS